MSKHWMDDLKHNRPQFIENFNEENPETVYRREFAKTVAKNPIKLKNYDNMVKEISREDSIAKAKAVVPAISSGVGDDVETLNFNGIVDDRKKKYWGPK